MEQSCRFTCFLMGDKSRLIQCAEILLQKGHQICGVISVTPSVLRWTKEKNLRQISPNDDIVGLLKQEPFDLFFSIDNFSKVPNEVLTLPRMYAINFHDAILPRYAGNNATNWALMNQETMHGITWHVMTDVIDAGDILKQKTLPISDEETALTLNAKCYEKSIEGFAELIDELAENHVKAVQQDLEKRTFFPRWKRPHAACAIDWTNTAEEIDARFRALDYGSYPNPLGLPKLYLGDQAIIVQQLEVLKSKPAVMPGTITLVTNETINVATGSQEVALRNFMSFNGEPLSPSAFLAECRLWKGDKLPKIKAEFANTVTRINSVLCKHEEYWIQRLACLEPIEIPYAKRRTSGDGKPQYTEARFPTTILDLAGGKISGNPGDYLLTAFILYLSRIGGKESFDVNYRDAALKQELSNTEVFFASHVPLRIEVEYKQRFEQFSKTIQQQIESLRAHGSYARDLMFRDPELCKKFNGQFCGRLPVALERVESLSGYRPKCDADLLIIIPDDGEELVWLYDEKVLDKTAIDRMWAQFETLLKDIANGKERAIAELSILPEQERKKLLIEWNNTDVRYPQNICLHQLFEAQVERTPEAVAVVFEEKQLSYRELNCRANHLAHDLQSLGVGPDALVGIFMERSLEMVIGILGILKAGGAYVPLDPIYPKERLSFMLEDMQASVILTQQSLAANLPPNPAKILYFDALDVESELDNTRASENPQSGVKPENLAYVIYTSGSTGKPKGVLVTHANVGRLFAATESWFHFGQEDIWTMFHSYAFDFSVWELWGALLYGGRLVVIPYEVSRSPKAFYELLVKEGVTVLNQTPSAFKQLMQAEESLRGEGDLYLRLIIFGGEALELQSLKPWIKRHGDKKPRLINMYGITETTVHVTYRLITTEDIQNGRGSVIGIPIPDLQVYVLDRNLQPVPLEVPGELYVGGAGVARGYLNRPELTSERFILNPFSNIPGERLYKTGDAARYLPDQDLEYLGRVDHQVQIRGFRVELGEIEVVLGEHEAMRQVAVMFREDAPGEKQLVAYIVPQGDQAPSVSELRAYLREKLPEYMVPNAFMILEEFPLTPNGKIDRRSLPSPTSLRPELESDYVAPRTEIERTLTSIWQSVLHLEKIGIHDNFFELGGHSLLLVRVLSKLQESSSKELSIVDMFRHPTINSLAKFLTQEQKMEPSLAAARGLAQKQRESLKRQKRILTTRR